jgi:hypothetical protein
VRALNETVMAELMGNEEEIDKLRKANPDAES